MYFWDLSKFLLPHESRSIAILDHFQSWKSLQHRLGGWKGNKSFFIHSLLLFTQSGSQQTYHHSYYCFLPPWCVQFCLFSQCFSSILFSVYIWILPFNECSQCQSQFTNPNTFQRLNATVTGTEKCFQYRNCVNNSFNYIDKYLYFFPFLSGCRLQYFSWTLWLVWNSNILQFASWSSDHWHLTGSSQGGNDAIL